MPFEKSDAIITAADAWNVAQGYTQLKILKPLVEMDKLVKIAIYGYEDIDQSIQFPEQIVTLKRIEAINRLIDVLREIIENTHFVMDKKSGIILEELEERVRKVENIIGAIHRKTTDQRTNEVTIVINDEHFAICLEELRDIKKEIEIPLNNKNLIFPSSDETDLEKIKNQLIFGG